MTLRKKKAWDCVIVGAGPAGLSAAVYMGRFRRSTLVLDSQDGRWSYGQVNDNYLGFPRGVRARRRTLRSPAGQYREGGGHGAPVPHLYP